MNIYITQANEEWLRTLPADKTMSGEVNKLIERARGASSLEVAIESFAEAMSEETGKEIRIVPEKPVKTAENASKNPEILKAKLYPELKANTVCPHKKVYGKCFEVECLTYYRMNKEKLK